MLSHSKLITGLVVAGIALLSTPVVATAATQLTTPPAVPAGKQGVVQVTVDQGVKVCSLAARNGKTRQGPFSVSVKAPSATIGWQVPAEARRGQWTLAVRCAASSRELDKAKAAAVKVTVSRDRAGGTRTLIKRGTVRVRSGVTATPAKDCAAAWNGYKSKRDDSTYCTGYDTWYAYSRAGDPAYKDLGSAAGWPLRAAARGRTQLPGIAARTIAWWPATADRPARVGYVERFEHFAIVVSEMNAERWNKVTTRTIPLGSPDMPKAVFPIVAPSPATQPAVVPVPTSSPPPSAGPWRPQLPLVGEARPRGPFQTDEIVTAWAVYGGPALDVVDSAMTMLGYGTDNVFRATHLDTAPPFNWALESGDVTGDGLADLITSGGSGYDVARSNGDGTFTALTGVTPIRVTNDLSVLDVDRDGKADLVPSDGIGGYTVWHSNGDGTFRRGITGAGLYWSPTVGDFTGDGAPDLFSRDTLLRSNGTGTFSSTAATGGNQLWHARETAGDIDGDGKDDLVMTVPVDNDMGVTPGLYFARSNGDGTFAQAQRFGDANPYPLELWTGDIDGDGNVDVVTMPSNEYVVHFGHGDGRFTPAVLARAWWSQAAEFAVADFDGR